MLHWIAVEIAMLEPSTVRFVMVCAFLMGVAVFVRMVVAGKRPQ